MKPARLIQLSKNCLAIISAEDYRRVNKYSWRVTQSKGTKRGHGFPYARGIVNGKDTYLHRFILGITDPNVFVDHKNHCTLDCRRENLELVSNLENQQRKRKKRGKNIPAHDPRQMDLPFSPAVEAEPVTVH